MHLERLHAQVMDEAPLGSVLNSSFASRGIGSLDFGARIVDRFGQVRLARPEGFAGGFGADHLRKIGQRRRGHVEDRGIGKLAVRRQAALQTSQKPFLVT